jgi:hypothetical protein
MVAWFPITRTALKLAPVALEVARQVDRQLRPHVLAYRRAKEIDGYVGSWTAERATHWLVFPRRRSEPVVAFPPLPVGELDLAHREIDREALKHHSDLPEAKLVQRAGAIKQSPGKAVDMFRRGERDA